MNDFLKKYRGIFGVDFLNNRNLFAKWGKSNLHFHSNDNDNLSRILPHFRIKRKC